MKKEVEIILNSYDMKISDLMIKAIIGMNLSLNEFIILVYFYNDKDKLFNPQEISKQFDFKENDTIEAITGLINKKLIVIETGKDQYGKIVEKINIKNLHQRMIKYITEDTKKKSETNIFEKFEKELNRMLSPIEYEIINSWLDNKIPEELIVGALKEAVYNGVSNLRYIDKIIYEWNKKGFKTYEDVKTHLVKKDDKKAPELFDYNWLDDEE